MIVFIKMYLASNPPIISFLLSQFLYYHRVKALVVKNISEFGRLQHFVNFFTNFHNFHNISYASGL